MPESCFLRAGGRFRPLAFASASSSVVSVVGVSVLLVTGGPLWSIVGILLGEAVFAAWVWRQRGAWLRLTAADAPRATEVAVDRGSTAPVAPQDVAGPMNAGL
jgi:hypothetical protein